MNYIPVELSFLKVAKRSNTDEIIKDYAQKCGERQNSSKKPILFRTYGWFDALMIIENPKSRCSISANQSKSGKSGLSCSNIMKTSFMGGYYEEGKYYKRLYTPYYEKIKKVRERLWNITEGGRSGEKIIWDKEDEEEKLILPKGLFVLSFIKLAESNVPSSTKSNNQNAVDCSNNSSRDSILERFMIIDYLGLWDIVILVKLKKDEEGSYKDSYELLEEYKFKFLISADEILQSSSIVLTPFKRGQLGEKNG